MIKRAVEENRFNWRLPLYAVFGTSLIFVPAAIAKSPDIGLLAYILMAVPIIIFSFLGLIGKKRGQRLSILSMLAVYLAISAILVEHYSTIRTATRWFVWSQEYKARVLAQPVPSNRELKHVKWDGWGWAGMDTTVFLVFDPTDSLSAAAMSGQPGKFSGIPCEVFRVRRMEKDWYAVQFYTDEYWGQHNNLDCGTGSKD